jgi:hypothetical protein
MWGNIMGLPSLHDEMLMDNMLLKRPIRAAMLRVMVITNCSFLLKRYIERNKVLRR